MFFLASSLQRSGETAGELGVEKFEFHAGNILIVLRIVAMSGEEETCCFILTH